LHDLSRSGFWDWYKTSDEVDYLSKGWENRIARTTDFFDKLTVLGNANAFYDTSEIKVTVVDIRNVGGKPAYHYFTNGTENWTTQNWSSTKFMGASFGIHNVRVRSNGEVGADIRYNGRVLASDLDIIGKESDNRYAYATKMLGGNRNADEMLENWLLAGKREPRDNNSVSLDTFGGAWGTRVDPCGNSPASTVKDLATGKVASLPADGAALSSDNLISGLTFAEWMKRIAVNERDPDTMPKLWNYSNGPLTRDQARKLKSSLTTRDLEILFYGSAAYSDPEFKARGLSGSDCGGQLGSTFSESGGQPRGGMMWDGLRDWPHMAGGTTSLTNVFGDRWRTLGKGGSGAGSNGKDDEAAIGWMCFPKTTSSTISFQGRELAVYVHFRNSKGRGNAKYEHMHHVAGQVFDRLVPGLRQGAPSDFAKGSVVVAIPDPGEAKAKSSTWLKRSPADSSALAPADKCPFPAGNILGYSSKTEDGSHTKLMLTGADIACPSFDKEAYVFTSHFEFTKKP